MYKNNGTYTCNQTPSKRLREKGKDYFQSMELTGEVHGMPKDPKSLKLDTYLEHFLLAMYEKAREISTKNGFKRSGSGWSALHESGAVESDHN